MKLCDLDTAKALQELGYDGEYAKSYTDFGNPTIDITTSLLYPTEIPAPRLDDVAYWLREKHKLSIEVGITMCRCWSTYIYDYSQENVTGVFCEIYDDYDSALEAAVNKAIEIIKKIYDTNRT